MGAGQVSGSYARGNESRQRFHEITNEMKEEIISELRNTEEFKNKEWIEQLAENVTKSAEEKIEERMFISVDTSDLTLVNKDILHYSYHNSIPIQEMLNELWHYINKNIEGQPIVKAYAFGRDWALKSEDGKLVIDSGGGGTDYRKLSEVGIEPGAKLIAYRLNQDS
jgi:hypothetical protein